MPDDLYEGREQTFIKHAFLRRYLETLAVKVLMGSWDTLNYVDGFAGPWKIRDEQDCTDASFGVAISLLQEVRAFVSKRRPESRLKIRFCLCEKDPDAANKLRTYAERNSDLEIHVFEGEFEQNLAGISARIPDGFTFTFIDPTNWVVRISDVCDFLTSHTGEFLFNFITEEVSRHAVNPKVMHQFGDFIGDPSWADTARNLPEGTKGELEVLRRLKDTLRERGAAVHLPDFSILKPLVNREKMRLMLGTRRGDGVKLFRDVHEKVEKDEFVARRGAKANQTRQDWLFSSKDFALYEQGERGIGCDRYRKVSEEIMLKALRTTGAKKFGDLALEVMERVPMRETHVKDLCRAMKQRGLIDYELQPRAKKPNTDTVIRAV